MHPTQSQLFADHYNFLRLLYCLEAEIAHYQCNEAWRVHLPVILDIFDYVQFYPEKYHYPVENAVLDLLAGKGVVNEDQASTFKSQQKQLEALTNRARELFNSVANDSVVPVTELVSVTREFLQRQFEHIDLLNYFLYPLLGHITDTEWDRIATEVARRRSALFRKEVVEEYQDLYHAIVSSDNEFFCGATARAIDKPAAAL